MVNEMEANEKITDAPGVIQIYHGTLSRVQRSGRIQTWHKICGKWVMATVQSYSGFVRLHPPGVDAAWTPALTCLARAALAPCVQHQLYVWLALLQHSARSITEHCYVWLMMLWHCVRSTASVLVGSAWAALAFVYSSLSVLIRLALGRPSIPCAAPHSC